MPMTPWLRNPGRSPSPAGAARRRAALRRAVWLAGPRATFAWLLAIVSLAACGYGMESPSLPNQRQSIGIDPIRNNTYEAELDVRLQEELRRRLFRDAGIRVAQPERSDLVLTVELKQLSLTRIRDVDSTNVRKLTLNMAGAMTLRDTVTGQVLYDKVPVNATTRYDLPESAVETPAVRDDALGDVIGVFADNVVRRLLLSF